MRRLAVLVAVFVAPWATSARADDPPVKRTLPELVKIARARSYAAKQQEATRRYRLEQKHEALWGWGPSFDATLALAPFPSIHCQTPLADDTAQAQALATSQGLTSQALRERDCLSTTVPSTGSNITVLSLNDISGVIFQTDLRLTQPLFSFGKIEYGTQAAGHGMAAAEAQAAAARDEVELQVTRAYFALKAARTALATLDEIRDKLDPWKKKIADDLDGAKPKFDFYDGKRIEYALIQVAALRADMERNAGIALDGLRLLCGDDAEVDDAELDLLEAADRPEEYYRHAALQHRPEVHALNEGVAGYRALANFQRSAMFPDLGLFLSLSYRQASTDIEDSQSAYQTHINYLGYGAGLVLREHFDLGQLARYRRSVADADALAAQRELALSGIGLEIATAYHDLEESRKRAALYDRGQRLTRGWLRSVDDDLEGGTPPRLIEAARAYFDQRLNYYRAINDVNYNIARLRRAAGVEVAR